MNGADLKNWRKDSGLSREQVANHLGVSSRTVEAWEQGKAQITDRGRAQLKSLMEEMDVLAIPLSPELKKKLREMAKAKGVDPAIWAQEILNKILLALAVAFLGLHLGRTPSNRSGETLAHTGKAACAFTASVVPPN